MAGRHRRPPAWRRLLLRLRRNDRAARFAALQVEVSVLRATVAELRSELSAARAAAAAQAETQAVALAAATPPTTLSWLSMDLPVLETPAVAAPAVAAVAAAPAATAPVLASAAAFEVKLDDTAEIEIVFADLPEAAMLDPRRAREDEVVDPATTIDLTGESTTSRRIA